MDFWRGWPYPARSELYQRFPTTAVVVTVLLVAGLAGYVLRQVRQGRQRQSERLDVNAR